MRGTSQASLVAAETSLEPVLVAAGAEASTVGAELFALVDALDGSGSLRRTLTDPSLPAASKEGLVRTLLAQADPRTADAAADAVRRRWSSEEDLSDALETLATGAVLAAADAAGQLGRVEEELFRFSRALVGQREARTALADPRLSPAQRSGLVDTILRGQVADATLQLARRAAQAPRGRRYAASLGHLGDLVAERRRRSVATVTSAAPLSPAQTARLEEILERVYGRAVGVNVVLDPTVLGGLRIQVGAQVVDATTLARLADARRRLAG